MAENIYAPAVITTVAQVTRIVCMCGGHSCKRCGHTMSRCNALRSHRYCPACGIPLVASCLNPMEA